MEPLFPTHQIIPGLANPNLASPPRKKLRQKLDFSSPPAKHHTDSSIVKSTPQS